MPKKKKKGLKGFKKKKGKGLKGADYAKATSGKKNLYGAGGASPKGYKPPQKGGGGAKKKKKAAPAPGGGAGGGAGGAWGGGAGAGVPAGGGAPGAGAGAGAGGAGAGAGAGGAPAGWGQGSSGQIAGGVASYGEGLMDPGSDYYQRLVDGMKTRIGKESAGMQRGNAIRAAQSGFGGGMSGNLMAANQDVNVAGMEAQGEAGAGMRLEAPKLGAGMALGAGGLKLGGEQLAEGGRQFDEGLDWNKDAFGQSLGQQQLEHGAAQGQFASAQQQQADEYAASAAAQEAQFQQQMDFAMEQLYGPDAGGGAPAPGGGGGGGGGMFGGLMG